MPDLAIMTLREAGEIIDAKEQRIVALELAILVAVGELRALWGDKPPESQLAIVRKLARALGQDAMRNMAEALETESRG